MGPNLVNFETAVEIQSHSFFRRLFNIARVSVMSIFKISHSLSARLELTSSEKRRQIFLKCLLYTEPQKKRRNLNNSIRYGKQSIYFFSLHYKFLLQDKVLVLITKSSTTINYRCTRILSLHIDNFIV